MALMLIVAVSMVGIASASGAPDVDCDDFCSSGGHGRGSAIGTAPFCGASCSSDCATGNKCQEPWSEGAGCMSGHKICCCSKAEEPEEPKQNTNSFMAPHVGDVDCGDGMHVAHAGTPMDEKVYGIVGSWEKGCSECGQNLQAKGTVPSGWYCEKAITGIWLKFATRPTYNTSQVVAQNVDCDDFCTSGGHGRGAAIGTAPFCGASCSSDCSGGNKCQEPWSEGAGCMSGHKICCCSKAEEPEEPKQNSKAKEPEDLKQNSQAMEPVQPTHNTSQIVAPHVDCDDFCASGGHGRGSAIGTAPFCGASCSSDCATGNKCQEPWSEGAGCMSGHKICCCSKAVEEAFSV